MDSVDGDDEVGIPVEYSMFEVEEGDNYNWENTERGQVIRRGKAPGEDDGRLDKAESIDDGGPSLPLEIFRAEVGEEPHREAKWELIEAGDPISDLYVNRTKLWLDEWERERKWPSNAYSVSGQFPSFKIR